MKFIIDTNIVFSGLVKDSITRKLLIDCPFELYAPETMINEIRKYEDLIIEKSRLTKNDFETLFALLTKNITVIERDKYHKFIKNADKVLGDIHKGDVPFLALGLAIENDGIWTDDKHFLKQDKIKVWKTKNIAKLFEELNID